MKKAVFLFIIIVALSGRAFSQVDEVVDTGKKIIYPDWLTRGTLKYGWLGSLCAYQSLNGVVDGHRFRHGGGGAYLATSDNYHMWATAQRTSGIVTGWFMYANIRDPGQTWMDKIRRGTGAAIISRNFFEWAYKWQRYNNPFDYSKEHNRCALVYFGIRDGKLVDLYVSTGEVTGPLVDLACLAIGWWIFK